MNNHSEQLLLFDLPNLLTKKLGRDFFLTLPEKPGVYCMLDDAEKIIYVGKSKNLKQRLNAYRSIKAEKADKRLVRLVNSVAAIDFDICKSEKAALRKENRLIRKHNPRYNRAQVYPYKNPYLICRCDGSRIKIRRQSGKKIPQIRSDEILFGSFPAGITPRALRAWQRLLLVILSHSKNGFALPVTLLENQYFKQLTLSFGCGKINSYIQKGFLAYLQGRHRWALWAITPRLCFHSIGIERSLRKLCWEDWKSAYYFFNSGPKRNRQLNRQRGNHPAEPISQDDVSDWQLERRLSST